MALGAPLCALLVAVTLQELVMLQDLVHTSAVDSMLAADAADTSDQVLASSDMVPVAS